MRLQALFCSAVLFVASSRAAPVPEPAASDSVIRLNDISARHIILTRDVPEVATDVDTGSPGSTGSASDVSKDIHTRPTLLLELELELQVYEREVDTRSSTYDADSSPSTVSVHRRRAARGSNFDAGATSTPHRRRIGVRIGRGPYVIPGKGDDSNNGMKAPQSADHAAAGVSQRDLSDTTTHTDVDASGESYPSQTTPATRTRLEAHVRESAPTTVTRREESSSSRAAPTGRVLLKGLPWLGGTKSALPTFVP